MAPIPKITTSPASNPYLYMKQVKAKAAWFLVLRQPLLQRAVKQLNVEEKHSWKASIETLKNRDCYSLSQAINLYSDLQIIEQFLNELLARVTAPIEQSLSVAGQNLLFSNIFANNAGITAIESFELPIYSLRNTTPLIPMTPPPSMILNFWHATLPPIKIAQNENTSSPAA